MTKISLPKIIAVCRSVKQSVLPLLILLALAGCKKDAPSVPTQVQDGSTIKFVLNDNFNFSIVYSGLSFVNLQDTLSKPGPYTFLAPDNTAFGLVGGVYTVSSNGYHTFGPARVTNMMRYSIMRGKISFKSIPLVQNKPFLTLTGGNVYVSKYVNGSDTVTTLNGVKVTSFDNAASNGLIQVLPQVLNAELYHNAVDCIHNDTTLSLFSAALQRTGLDASMLKGTDEYTLLAPSNTAFHLSAKLGLNLGISTLDSILTADPAKLTAFLKYHIMKGRHFEGDLYRYAAANPDGITMLNDEKVIVGGYAPGWHAITFLGNGNKGIVSPIAVDTYYDRDPTVYYANIPCGNGVIHIISQVLIP